MNDCHARYVCRFDACIVCMKQGGIGGGGGGGGLITMYTRGTGTCMYMWYPTRL